LSYSPTIRELLAITTGTYESVSVELEQKIMAEKIPTFAQFVYYAMFILVANKI